MSSNLTPAAMGFRRGVVAAALCALLALVVPASSSAAAPILKSVTSTHRHPTATWRLPPRVTAEVIEIASKPDTGYDGYFATDSAVVFALLRPRQTSWRGRRQLAPGTYYVHVKGADFTGCGTVPQGVCDSFWSNVLRLTIARPAKAKASLRTATSARRCRKSSHRRGCTDSRATPFL